MSITTLLTTASLTVRDLRCDARRGETPFTEVHGAWSVSYVRRGSFGLQSRGRSFELVPGSIMVGHPGDEYVCSHDHHVCGDECLSFRLAEPLVERIGGRGRLAHGLRAGVARTAGAGRTRAGGGERRGPGGPRRGRPDARGPFRRTGFGSRAEAGTDPCARPPASHRGGALDERAFARAHRSGCRGGGGRAEPVPLPAALFRRVGVTPHQYLVRCRVQHAARLLATRTGRSRRWRWTSGSRTSRTSSAPFTARPGCRRDASGSWPPVTARFSKKGSPRLHSMRLPFKGGQPCTTTSDSR